MLESGFECILLLAKHRYIYLGIFLLYGNYIDNKFLNYKFLFIKVVNLIN